MADAINNGHGLIADNNSNSWPPPYGASRILKPFEPHATDPFINPKRNDLISYMWTRRAKETEPDIYRTGVLVTDLNQRGTGRIRFYDGSKSEDGIQRHRAYIFQLKEGDFQKNMFRVRMDLMQTPCRCYDILEQSWCVLKEIDVSTGGVFVLYGGAEQCVLVSADNLVSCDGPSDNTDMFSLASEAVSSSEEEAELEVEEEEEDSFEEAWMVPQPMIATPATDNDVATSSIPVDPYLGLSVNTADMFSLSSEAIPLEEEELEEEDLLEWMVSQPMIVTPLTDNYAHVPTSNLPKFKPRPTDPYLKPGLDDLVSYKWDKENNYRTGILIQMNGTIRFFDGLDEIGKPLTQKHSFHINTKTFKNGMFRTRVDLKVNNDIYDWSRKKWCILTEIDSTCGGVYVRYPPDETAVCVSPDDLVGRMLSDDLNEPRTPLSEPSRETKRKEREWTGVVCSEDSQGPYYIRGLLRESNSNVPWLVAGEVVRYYTNSTTQVQMLELKKGQHVEIKDVGRLQPLFNKYKEYTKEAELKYANAIRKERFKRRDPGLHRSTSLELRPLQPVCIVGGRKQRDAIVIKPTDNNGFVNVKYSDGVMETIQCNKVRLIGHQPDPIVLKDFFLEYPLSDMRQSPSYHKDANFLINEWKKKNGEQSDKFQARFEQLVADRKRRGELMCTDDEKATLTPAALAELKIKRREDRTIALLLRLQEDYNMPREISGMDGSMFKDRIKEIKRLNPHPNMLLLCGGFAPEAIAHARLPGAADLGTVIIQDTDLRAVGVAVAANPQVEFAIVIDDPSKDPSISKYEPGDVRILSSNNIQLVRDIEVRLGGIHVAKATNPCTSFSLAGNKQGLRTADGQLLLHCAKVITSIGETSEEPEYTMENVPSTAESNQHFDASLPNCGASFFYVDGAICSPSSRRRKFATNLPPPVCSIGPREATNNNQPPSLNGDLPEYSAQIVTGADDERIVHPDLKKFPCLTVSSQKRSLIYQRCGDYEEPNRTTLTPDEAERAMGYTEHEVGVTRRTCHKAVLKRIKEHDYARDGCLVSLKGCADEEDLVEALDDKTRHKLLGNSQVVTLLEALMWNQIKLFPGF